MLAAVAQWGNTRLIIPRLRVRAYAFNHCFIAQYETALNTCDPLTLLRIGTLFPEMSVHEKSVDFYIELLRKDQVCCFGHVEGLPLFK
jgi:hypothetical protein